MHATPTSMVYTAQPFAHPQRSGLDPYPPPPSVPGGPAQEAELFFQQPASQGSSMMPLLNRTQPQHPMPQPQYSMIQPQYSLTQPHYSASPAQYSMTNPGQFSYPLQQPWLPSQPGMVHLNPGHMTQQQASFGQSMWPAEHAQQSSGYSRHFSDPYAHLATGQHASSGRQSRSTSPQEPMSHHRMVQNHDGYSAGQFAAPNGTSAAQHMPPQHAQQAEPPSRQSMRSNEHAQHAVPGSLNANGVHGPWQAQQGQQARQAGQHMHSNGQHSASQHAQHAAQGQEHSARSRESSPKQDHSSAAFIVWVDAHYKHTGQTAKRVELRQFVQHAKVSCNVLRGAQVRCRPQLYY